MSKKVVRFLTKNFLLMFVSFRLALSESRRLEVFQFLKWDIFANASKHHGSSLFVY